MTTGPTDAEIEKEFVYIVGELATNRGVTT